MSMKDLELEIVEIDHVYKNMKSQKMEVGGHHGW